MIIFTPILAPMAQTLGFKPIHWGLLMVVAISRIKTAVQFE
jgi:TRAP-type C4-dicarboxylate transport system permease large subunit